MNFFISEENIPLTFEAIAKQLISGYALVVNEAIFRFTELEFYYFSESHPDGFTHLHSEEAGKWRFHNSGLDITLRGSAGYGGILIRGIRRYQHKEESYINGPRRVLFEIGKYLNVVTAPDNSFGIRKSDRLDIELFQTYREGLGQPVQGCPEPDKFREARYRFLIAPHNFQPGHLAGKEKIARSFNDPEQSLRFLKYELKQ